MDRAEKKYQARNGPLNVVKTRHRENPESPLNLPATQARTYIEIAYYPIGVAATVTGRPASAGCTNSAGQT